MHGGDEGCLEVRYVFQSHGVWDAGLFVEGNLAYAHHFVWPSTNLNHQLSAKNSQI